MRLCLFEDDSVADLGPLTLTRPAFDLLCGRTSLASKQCRLLAGVEVGVLVRPLQTDVVRLEHPAWPVNDLTWLRADTTVLVNGRWLPPPEGPAINEPGLALIGDEVAYAVIPADRLVDCSPNTLIDCLESWKQVLPQRPAGGRLVRYPWDLVQYNAEQLAVEFHAELRTMPRPRTGTGHALVGPADRLVLHPSAQLDPLVVIDTTRGPVFIDQDAEVMAFSRLEGPCCIGPRSQVLGAKIRAGTTVGPDCRVGGEVEASILHGYSNKYHDGFLGHSYVGAWVNLGAGTHNSDLRHDYAPVSAPVQGRSVATGLSKVGCFIGDHTKTGLGTLINTGSTIGAFCELLPAGGLLPKYFPSFTRWWNGALCDHAGMPDLLATAAEVMRRRGQRLTEAHAALYRQVCDHSAAERRQAIGDANRRMLRRSA